MHLKMRKTPAFEVAPPTIAHESEKGGLTILSALAQLRDDLEKLQSQNVQKGRQPIFVIEGGGLELKLIAKRDAKAEGKGQAKFKL